MSTISTSECELLMNLPLLVYPLNLLEPNTEALEVQVYSEKYNHRASFRSCVEIQCNRAKMFRSLGFTEYSLPIELLRLYVQ